MGKRDLEFRAEDDDAWYTVKVQLQGDTLLIEFQGILETAQFAASMFHSQEAVERFVRRFRVFSPQLQDSECRRISKGSIVCAACHAFRGDDMRYYDAIVEAVDRKAHSCANEGEEECRCTFVLSWLHGPNTGLLTSAGIASVCTVNDEGRIDRKVATFSRLAKSKVAVSSRKNTSIYRKEASAGLVLAKGGWRQLLTDQKNFSFQDIQSRWKLIYGSESKGADNSSNLDSSLQDHDKDLGGETSNCHFILLGNLERSLSPSSIQKFIHRHTCVSPQVYILLSPISTHFARAVLVVDTRMDHRTLCQFLDNPDHLVVSTSGRPWVLIESVVKLGMNKTLIGRHPSKSEENGDDSHLDDELTLVHHGSEEYRRAQQLRGLFIDFYNHEQLMLRRLVEEEKEVIEAFSSLQQC